jgi:hypothetical protein
MRGIVTTQKFHDLGHLKTARPKDLPHERYESHSKPRIDAALRGFFNAKPHETSRYADAAKLCVSTDIYPPVLVGVVKSCALSKR